MAKTRKQMLTLDQPIMYQIKVPGHLGGAWMNWFDEMNLEIGNDETGMPITLLTSKVDQAGLIGLLRRLYSLGLPLISVKYLEAE